MASYPRALRFFLSSISITKQQYKKRVESPNSTAGPNDTIIFSAPSTSVNMDSVHLQFDFTTETPTALSNYARLSKNTESLIQQFQVETNGTIIDGGCRYTNVLLDTMHDYMVDQNKTPMRSVLQNDYTASPVVNGNVHLAQPMVISTFPGFVGTAQPRILPCDVLPLRMHLRLADTKCLITNDAAATFELANIHVVYETIAIEDGGLFDTTLRESLLKAPLEIPFDLWKSHSPGASDVSNSTMAQANTESLDLLLGVTLHPDALATPNAYNSVTGKATYFKRGYTNTSDLQYSWFTVQGVPFPSWQPSPAEAFAQTQINFGKLNDSVGGSAAWLKSADNVTGKAVLDAYCKHGWAHLCVFSWPGHEEAKEMRLRSGLNVSGSTSGIEFLTTGSGSGMQKILFSKQTSVLLVGASQQVQVRA